MPKVAVNTLYVLAHFYLQIMPRDRFYSVPNKETGVVNIPEMLSHKANNGADSRPR